MIFDNKKGIPSHFWSSHS